MSNEKCLLSAVAMTAGVSDVNAVPSLPSIVNPVNLALATAVGEVLVL